jgi:hypothetical protein
MNYRCGCRVICRESELWCCGNHGTYDTVTDMDMDMDMDMGHMAAREGQVH